MKMSLLQRVGGRKFLLALIVIALGTVIELYTQRGITASFAGLLTAIVASFSAANYGNTKEYYKQQAASKGDTSSKNLEKEIRQLKKLVEQAVEQSSSPEAQEAVTELRENLRSIKELSEHIGNSVVNVANIAQNTHKIVAANVIPRNQ